MINLPDFEFSEIVDGNIFSKFIEQFDFSLQMLNFRINKVLEIDTSDKRNNFEYLMAFDAAMTLFRAMFLESKNLKGNYTFQNLFRISGKPDIAVKIDECLDRPFENFRDTSVRNVLKFITDKFVCHVDGISIEDLGMANYYMSALKNPYAQTNIASIYKNLAAIINNV